MKTNKRTPQKEATAYHEAGHAVMCHKLGYRVKRITIIPNGTSLGECTHEGVIRRNPEFDGSTGVRMQMEKVIMICLAGNIAQRMWRARSVRSHHASSDYQSAVDLALRINGTGSIATAHLRWLRLCTKQVIESSWQTVEALAADLLKEGSITINTKRPTISDPVSVERGRFFWR